VITIEIFLSEIYEGFVRNVQYILSGIHNSNMEYQSFLPVDPPLIYNVYNSSKAGCEITAGGSPVKVTGQLNFSSDIPNIWPVKLFSLKQSLVKYTPKNVTIFPV
jgi:hypothetical protein